MVGIGDFLHVFGNLDLRNHRAVRLLDGSQLVHAAEYRLALRGDQPLAHAEHVDLRPLPEKVADDVLVQRVGHGDLAVRPPGLVQHFPGFPGQIREVAGVQTDAALRDAHGFQDFVERPDGVGDAGFQGVVGVHKQRRVVGEHLHISLERLVLAVKHLNPCVGHGAARVDAVELVGNGAGRAMAAADVRGSRAQDSGVRALRPAGTEFQHGASLGGTDNTVGLGGDQALMVHAQQQIRLHQLRLNGGRADGDNRLPGENGRSLRHRPDIAGKLEIGQIVQKILAEALPFPQVRDVLRVKMQLLNILDDLLQTGRNGEPAPVRAAAEKQVKIGYAVGIAVGKVPRAHGQLVKIAEHRQIQLVTLNHSGHLIFMFAAIIQNLSENSNLFR